MKKKPKELDTLLRYWKDLSKADIALCKFALTQITGRDNPGTLPFTPLSLIADALYALAAATDKKGPWFRVIHKIEGWQWRTFTIAGTDHVMVNLDEERYLKILPPSKRVPLHDKPGFRFKLPFTKDVWLEACVLPKGRHSIKAPAKYRAGLQAWLEGVTTSQLKTR